MPPASLAKVRLAILLILLQCFPSQVGLPLTAPLVELSAILSQPGSEEQLVHSDTSHMHSDALIVSIFIALTKVTLKAGPTYVYPATHVHDFHSDVQEQQPAGAMRHYSSDGEEDMAHAEVPCASPTCTARAYTTTTIPPLCE